MFRPISTALLAISLAAPVQALGPDPGLTQRPGQVRTEFDLETATVTDINRAIDRGALTSEQLVRLSLARIRAYEPKLHAIITLNPHALDEARALDAERRRKGRRSLLHGIPVLIKDNINTRDLPTTLGFYGLKGARAASDAAVVTRLRTAGAIILAKTNLSELASGPPMSSLGGQTRNPYNLAYSPAGSSNGTAVGIAAGYAPIGIATDTTGSARWPAATNGVVGMRPTMGLFSATGVQPNAVTLDTVGAMARSVADVALVTRILADRQLPAEPKLDPGALRGVRIGFPRAAFSGDDPEIDAVTARALETLRASGATVIDIELPDWLIHLSDSLQALLVQSESVPSLDAYLSASFPSPWPRSHAAILTMSEALTRAPVPGAFANPGRLGGYRWEAAALPFDDPLYVAARTDGRQFFRTSLLAILKRYNVSTIVYPTQTMRINRLAEGPVRNKRGLFGNFGPTLASIAGWPDITVPAGATPEGLPVGVSFLGPASSDGQVLSWAFAFEQQAHGLRQPAATPPLRGERFVY
ncbi:amidase [Sphingomonas sp. IBVSS2]|uniref:amidase n=1 Tax=Sphingomonas sp. IBVSS2 TaxID=1985172 RepID=UPI0015C51AAA|nr:amidase family protein [Sphingomonas sp. IBVSS2]